MIVDLAAEFGMTGDDIAGEMEGIGEIVAKRYGDVVTGLEAPPLLSRAT